MMTSGNLATAQPSVPPPLPLERPPRRSRREGLLAPELVRAALKQSFIMLRPDIQWKNPVMFVVEVGAFLTLLFTVKGIVAGSSSQVPVNYFIALDAWLFLDCVVCQLRHGGWLRRAGRRRRSHCAARAAIRPPVG